MNFTRLWNSIAVLVFLVALANGFGQVHAQERNSSLRLFELHKQIVNHKQNFSVDPNRFDNNFKIFNGLVHELGQLKEYMHSFALELQDQIQRGDALDGIQLDNISKVLENFVNYTIAIGHYTQVYAPGKNKQIEELFNTLDNKKDLKDMVWLTGHLAIFDFVYQAHSDFYSIGILRRVLKDIILTDSRITKRVQDLADVLQKTMSMTNRMTLELAVKQFVKKQSILDNDHKDDQEITSIIKETINLPSTKEMVAGRSIVFNDHHAIDNFIVGTNNVMNILSGYFGNAAGAIRWRSGRLYNDPAKHKLIESRMRPLDIISERTPFALTDFFIPGNFGHIALWLGSEEQLKEFGLWEHPLIVPHHDAIRNGIRILEAVRPRTRLASLEDFLNIDELAVMRQENLFENKVLVDQILNRAMPQLGKDYDFNFDVTTVSKIVCSELIYHAYAEIKWPTSYIFGRATISPDQVAELALWDNSPIAMSTYVLGLKNGEMKELNVFDFAKNLGYVVNKELSSEGSPKFDKPYTKCRMVEKFKRVRVGSRRQERVQIKVCETAYKHYVYGE